MVELVLGEVVKRTPMRRGRVPVGAAARKRIRGGGIVSKGRPSLSFVGCLRLREMLLIRARGRCEACGGRPLLYPLEREHALARSRGGGDSWLENWITCRNCHRWKEASFAGSHGRLLITILGNGTFEFSVAVGKDKRHYTIERRWIGGRAPTPEEAAELATLR